MQTDEQEIKGQIYELTKKLETAKKDYSVNLNQFINQSMSNY